MSVQNRLWILMGKKLSGAITDNEEDELDMLFQQYPDVWYAYEVLASQQPDRHIPDAFIAELKTLLNGDEQASPSEPQVASSGKVSKLWLKISVAALIVVAFALTLLNYLHADVKLATTAGNRANEIVVLKGTKTDVTLPDGSRIVLNSGSRLRYPKNYALSAIREVWLTGEAYFKIKHDNKHPFIIHTKNMDIRDIGTVFNVKAYPDELPEASLLEGAIEVSLKNISGKKILLKPHQKIVLLGGNDIRKTDFSVQAAGSLTYKLLPVEADKKDKTLFPETAWVNDQLVFRNEAFEDVAKMMERRYNVEIVFDDDKAKDCRLTGVFKIETVDQALNVLQQVSPFEYRIDHDRIHISSRVNN